MQVMARQGIVRRSSKGKANQVMQDREGHGKTRQGLGKTKQGKAR